MLSNKDNQVQLVKVISKDTRVLCVGFCSGHFVMVPLNVTSLHCLQHSFFGHLFNLYSNV